MAVTLFKWIACSTVMATLLVFMVLLVKLFFKNRLGARWHYLIWMLVILKLLIPFGPQSKLSVYNLFNLTDHKITEQSYAVMNTISTATNNIATNTPIPYLGSAASHEASPIGQDGDKVINLSILGLLLWFIGAASVALHIYKRNLSLYRELKSGKLITDVRLINCLIECKKRMGIKNNIILKGVSNLKTPALFGIFNPVLLIPLDMLDECSIDQIKYAIFHELAHLKRKDITMNFLLSILVVVHWFNPLIWYAFYKMRQDTEMACDQLVLSYLDSHEQKNYGLAIIRLIEKFSTNLKLSNAIGFIGSKSLVKKRITLIASYKKRSLKLSVFAVFVFTILVLAAFTNAVEGLNMSARVIVGKSGQLNNVSTNTSKDNNFFLVKENEYNFGFILPGIISNP